MSCNKLIYIGNQSFARLKNLTRLNIDNNMISAIDDNAFTDLVSLKRLQLGNNMCSPISML